MAVSYRLELDHEGIKQLLNSDEIAAVCEQAAERIARTAGDGFEAVGRRSYSFNGGRAGSGVEAATYEACLEEAEFKTLSTAVSSCRS